MTQLVLYVDADANPVKTIIAEEAEKHQVQAIFVCSFANHFGPPSPASQLVTVDKSYQSVDMYIVNKVKRGDLVVTDDYGLASLVLARGCLAISSRGKEYTNHNIDQLLMSRHLSYKERISGNRPKGPKRLAVEDELFFRKNLQKCLQSMAGDFASFDE
ncbi:MAG TPA: YaiI/YqxD family protein [Bacillota bacterium]|nr:YaiI/YqxD family protein [Bacillota bacterium]